jgi:hypothetical protein
MIQDSYPQVVKNGAESASTPSAISGRLSTRYFKPVTVTTGSYNEFSGHKGNSSLTKPRDGVLLSSEFTYDS